MVIDADKRCEHCRELFSLLLDVGLSELELALVRRHLRSCSSCRRFAADVEGATTLLRTAPVISPGMPIMLPRRRTPRRAVAVLSSAASLAAAATVAVIGLNGNPFSGAGQTALRHAAVQSDLPAMRLIRSRQLRIPSSETNVQIRQIESD